MNKFLSNFILLSSVLILTASVALYLSTQTQLMIDDATPTRETLKGEKGQLKYSIGSCEEDKNCIPSGCSSQICSSDASIITTCEYSSDFPDKEIYKCGCVEKSCSWYK